MTGLRGSEIPGKITVNDKLTHIRLVQLNYNLLCEYLRKYSGNEDLLLWAWVEINIGYDNAMLDLVHIACKSQLLHFQEFCESIIKCRHYYKLNYLNLQLNKLY